MWELARIVFLGTMAGVLGTGAGGILLALGRRPKGSELSFWLGLSAGVMLAVVFQDLLPEALTLQGARVTFGGLVLGMCALMLLEPLVFRGRPRGLIQTGLFLGLGIAAHNFPEGLAIGAGYSASQELGFSLALALCLHNVPEGMAMAAPLLAGGAGRTQTVLWTIAAGLPMGLGALVGGLFGSLTARTLAGTLGFAAGAMLFLVFHELLPEANCLDFPYATTCGAVFGIMLGLTLLVVF
ncbi:MAG: ZIP family metal transporter [Limnochordia bacterium]|nr:ZIP family metal transporter [Bacillota bacterium]